MRHESDWLVTGIAVRRVLLAINSRLPTSCGSQRYDADFFPPSIEPLTIQKRVNYLGTNLRLFFSGLMFSVFHPLFVSTGS